MTPFAEPTALLPDEPPQQHIRNALALLAIAQVGEHGRRELTAAEYAAVWRRLDRAVAQLEHRPMTAQAP